MPDHSSHLKEELIDSIEQKVENINQLLSSLENTVDDKSNHALTVLIAEDVDSNYLLLKNILKKEYRILRAHDGLEAIEMFQKECPDLILMDIKMPNMDGWEATRIIREHSATIPIIAQTSFAYKADKEKAVKMGFSDFLTKPISISLLRQTLKKYI